MPQKNSSSREAVLNANRKVHDTYSEEHDSIVSHIVKQSCHRDYIRRIDEILKMHGKQIEGANILELGCGTGNWGLHFTARGAESYTGCDISNGMTEKAKNKLKETKSNIRCMPIEDFDPKTVGLEKFDIIFSFSFIHHLYDLDIFFDKIQDWLLPDGLYLAMHEPNTRQLQSERKCLGEIIDEIASVLAGLDTPRRSLPSRVSHVLSMLLAKLGFDVAPNYDELEGIIDYQLTTDGFNAANIQDRATQRGLNARSLPYSYYRFRIIGYVFGTSKNFFALTCANNK